MTFFTVTLLTALLMVGVHQSTAGNIEEIEGEMKAMLETRLEHELEIERRDSYKRCMADTDDCTNTAKGGIGPNAACVEGARGWYCKCNPNYTWSISSKACVSDSNNARNLEEIEGEMKAMLETRLEHELEIERRDSYKRCMADTDDCTNTAKGGIGPNAACVEGARGWYCKCNPNYTWSISSKACVSDSNNARNLEEIEGEMKAMLETRLEHELEIERRDSYKRCMADTDDCTNTAKGGIGPNAACVEGARGWYCKCNPNYTWSVSSKACVSDSNNARNLENLLRGLLYENQE
ncbi:fibropellin-2-like [Amphiura filiformis]|uniref:fibropellin-2-like n=1 Tax=Amphiura filiformis TaxID=82378 RepID=UPI003B20EC5F